MHWKEDPCCRKLTGSNIHECKNAKSKLVSETMPIMKMKKGKESRREMQEHPGLVQPSQRKVRVKRKLKEKSLGPHPSPQGALNKLLPALEPSSKRSSLIPSLLLKSCSKFTNQMGWYDFRTTVIVQPKCPLPSSLRILTVLHSVCNICYKI